MSALQVHKAKGNRWEFCANKCATKNKSGDRGPRMGQQYVLLLGRPINGDLDDSFFCPGCVKELRAVWDSALREREEADQQWLCAVDEVAA